MGVTAPLPLSHGPLERVRGVEVSRNQRERGGDPQQLRNVPDFDGHEYMPCIDLSGARGHQSKYAGRGVPGSDLRSAVIVIVADDLGDII